MIEQQHGEPAATGPGLVGAAKAAREGGLPAFGTWEWSPATDTLRVSDNACLLLGIDPRRRPSARPQRLWQGAPAQDRAALEGGIALLLAKGEPIDTDFIVVSTIGEHRALRMQAECHDRDDPAACVLGVVSPRHETVADAGTARARPADVLARAAFDLRSPLHAIRGFAEMIASNPMLPERERGHVDAILGASQYLASISESMYLRALLERGDVEPMVERIDLTREAADVVARLQPAARFAQISLRADTAGPAWVLADRRYLSLVLMNLVANGVKFNRPGGQVVLATRAAGPGRVRVLIADTGRGLHIARPNAGRCSEGSGPGSPGGFGYQLCRDLLRHMDGTIECETARDEGMRVELTLPAA
ncbi:MAG: HAMP domain-containing histidine kinase [Burkholderiaceae bacterium]|nr:HAMP domain-containing histidine kinase [Burkholderiaceae bacterium]